MSYIIDRLILIFMSVIILVMECNITQIIVISLIAITISGLCYFFDNRKITGAIGIIYMLGCLFIPGLICVAPVVIYELYGCRLYVEMVIVGIIFLANITGLSPLSIALIIVTAFLACVMYAKTSTNEKLGHMVKSIRDDSEEKSLLLAEKNKHLIEKQDSEIYVATLKERNRIAREIHDNVGHMITRSILQMGALMTINKEEPLHSQLESVKNNLDVAMNNIRESVHDLHDESVDLKQTITELATGLDSKFTYKIDYDISTRIGRNYKYTIIGIVKEAVSNIIKHSENDIVDIILREHPGMYQVVVHDYRLASKHDEQANTRRSKTDIDYLNSGGIGMQNMRDRVESLHGNIAISTENGFRIFVSLPKTEDC